MLQVKVQSTPSLRLSTVAAPVVLEAHGLSDSEGGGGGSSEGA